MPSAIGLGFNPNPVGLFLAVVSILAYGLFLLHPSGWRTRVLTLGVFAITFLGLLATMSRAALAGWLLGLLILSLLTWVGGDQARTTTLKRVGLAVLLMFLVGSFSHLFTTTEASERLNSDAVMEALRGRVSDWRLSKPIIREHFLAGVGAGNSPVAIKEKWSPDTVGGVWVPVHSVALLILSGLGVFGWAAWAVIMVAPIIWLVSRRHIQHFEMYPLLALGPLLVLLFVGLLEFSPWSTQDNRLLMWAVLGLWAGGMVTLPSSQRVNEVPARRAPPQVR